MKKKLRDIITLNKCAINDKSYDVWFLRHEARQTEFFVTFSHSLLIYNNLKTQNFEKIKKMPGDIILQKCAKNYDHMLYSS